MPSPDQPADDHMFRTEGMSRRIPYPNRRRQRAEHMAAVVMNAIAPVLRNDGEVNGNRHAQRALEDIFNAIGVEVITDQDRAAAGLRLRDWGGYTLEELAILEAHRLSSMMKPMVGAIPVWMGVDFAIDAIKPEDLTEGDVDRVAKAIEAAVMRCGPIYEVDLKAIARDAIIADRTRSRTFVKDAKL